MLLSILKDVFRGKSFEPENTVQQGKLMPENPDKIDPDAKSVLNVGGNSKSISLPPQYAGWRHLLLDIDPRGNPDILCDARSLTTLAPAQFDAIYCSHNLEHYFHLDVKKVLACFHHVLKDVGFAHIRVPDMGELMKRVVEDKLDIEDFLYESPAGPIHVIDVMYGWGAEIEQSGNDYFAHKTGFTEKSMRSHLKASGFTHVYTWAGNLEISAVAFKNMPSSYCKGLFNLPDSPATP